MRTFALYASFQARAVVCEMLFQEGLSLEDWNMKLFFIDQWGHVFIESPYIQIAYIFK